MMNQNHRVRAACEQYHAATINSLRAIKEVDEDIEIADADSPPYSPSSEASTVKKYPLRKPNSSSTAPPGIYQACFTFQLHVLKSNADRRTMEKFLADWRKDAVDKHQYDSAIFIGDKLLALTNDDKDAFWLAQVHFTMGNYTRAQGFLARQNDLVSRNPQCKYLSAHCFIKLNKFDEAMNILGDKNPTHLITSSSNSRRKLQHAKNGLTKTGRGTYKLERDSRSEEREKEDATNIKFEAAMCYLRGICHAKQNAFDRAKECYKDAVRIDVQCFEAFDQLMKNSLMSPDEEWTFLESLDFDSVSAVDPALDKDESQEAAEFARMLFTTRLSKYKNPGLFTQAIETLSTHYNLTENADLQLARAELLFTQCRFKETLIITSKILEVDKYNFSVYPLHLACLSELNAKNKLFLVAHDLVDNHPDESVSWLAIGVYYLTIGKIAEARRYFSKASMMDPHFGPAWIGFAHTFAAEGEHDQAISAYSTAARLFQGTHLPQLFLGMQNLQLNNMTLADEYLKSAYALCKTDPLLLNEMGVVFYHQEHLQDAVDMFKQALRVADEIDSEPGAWVATRANLGHAYRRLGMLDKALETYKEVLRQGGRDAGIFSAKGLVLMQMNQEFDAIVSFHEALALSPQDPIATDLLTKALEGNARLGVTGSIPSSEYVIGQEVDDECEKLLAVRKREAQRRVEAGRSGSGSRRSRGAGKQRSTGTLLDETSMMEVSEEEEA